MHILKYQNMHNLMIFFSNKHTKTTFLLLVGTAGVVVSCKIPILATRVRFPGDAHVFFNSQGSSSKLPQCFAAVLHKSARVA